MAVVEAAGGETAPTWRQPQDDAKPARRRSQGHNLSPGKRKAIEEWEVTRAIERFPELDLRDVGSTKSWDLEDTSFDPPVRIEVKGSTLQLDTLILTDNEVEHAKKARDEGVCRLILVVVEEIELGAGGQATSVTGVIVVRSRRHQLVDPSGRPGAPKDVQRSTNRSWRETLSRVLLPCIT